MKKIIGFLLLCTLALSARLAIAAEPELLNFFYSIRVYEKAGDKERFITSLPAVQAYTPNKSFDSPRPWPHHSFSGQNIGYAERLSNGSLISKIRNYVSTAQNSHYQRDSNLLCRRSSKGRPLQMSRT